MAKDVLEYKGYVAKVTFDVQAHLLRGKVQGIVDSVDFESDSLDGVEAAFQDAVDRYLAFCAAVGRRPAERSKAISMCALGPICISRWPFGRWPMI